MKIGAHLSVRNERNWIGRVLRYHLEVQKFDVIIVNDDASYDGTKEAIQRYAEQDSRVVPIYTEQEKGFTQDVFSKVATDMLFEEFDCDVVLPIDADEFWISESHFFIRDALQILPNEQLTLVTDAYDFFPTEKDDLQQEDPIVRLKYCRVHDVPKVAFYKSSEHIEKISLGNHAVVPKYMNVGTCNIPINRCCRYHFRWTSKNAFLRKILGQVEGFIVKTKGDWLHHPKKYGGWHIWHHYMNIRDGGIDEEFKKIIVPKKRLEELLKKKEVLRRTNLHGHVPQEPSFLATIS